MQPPTTPASPPPGAARPPPPPAPGPRESKWLSAVGVLAVIVFVSLGGFLFAGEPTAAGEEIGGDGVTPGSPIPVGPVSVRPAAGWTIAEQIPDPPQLRLTEGTAQLFVVLPPFQASAEGHAQGYIDEVLTPQAGQLSVSPIEPIDLPSGHPAAFAAYVGQFDGVQTPLEGEIVAVASPSGTQVVFDGWAPKGLFVGIREEIREMVAGAEVP
jgi:hypothetical protein